MIDRSTTQTVSIGFFWPLVFLCLFLTGNCGMCGGDVNYVERYMQAVENSDCP